MNIFILLLLGENLSLSLGALPVSDRATPRLGVEPFGQCESGCTNNNNNKRAKIEISDESQSVLNDRSSCYCFSSRVSGGI